MIAFRPEVGRILADESEPVAANADRRFLDHRHRGVGGQCRAAADHQIEWLAVGHGVALASVPKCSEKAAGPRFARPPEDLGGRPLLHDAAVVHEDDPVRDLPGERHLMRDDDAGHPARRECADRIEHLAHQLGIERRGRLVEQNDRRLHRDRAGDRDALLLAARQLGRTLVEMIAEKHFPQLLGGARARDRLRQPEHMARPDRHIVQCREVRKQVEALEHEADAAALDRELAFGRILEAARDRDPPDRTAVNVDRAAVRESPGAFLDAAQQRSFLPEPDAPDHHHRLAAADVEVDIAQHRARAEALRQVPYAQHRRRRAIHHSTGMRFST